MQQHNTNIKEIFTSIQGEGPYIGQKHIFVRFCRCNLNCKYCDTDFDIKNSKKYSPFALFDLLKNIDADTISFTGGEPLIEVEFLEEFLKEYKNKLNKKIYLETNGVLYKNLEKIIDFIDIISMDIKLKSASGMENFEENEKFSDIASKKEVFIKIVFDKNIKDEEIIKTASIAKKHDSLIILQPKMPMDKDIDIEKIFNKFYKHYKTIRLIPQVHKFLNLL